jgi:hypothetical protein
VRSSHPLRVYIPVLLPVVSYPFIPLWSIAKVSNPDLEVTLCPPGVNDLINHMLFHIGCCDIWRGSTRSLHNLMCHKVKLASVEHIAPLPSGWEFKAVCERSHDLLDPSGSMPQGIQLWGWPVTQQILGVQPHVVSHTEPLILGPVLVICLFPSSLCLSDPFSASVLRVSQQCESKRGIHPPWVGSSSQ